MMQDKTIRALGSWQIGMPWTAPLGWAGLGLAAAGFMAACAGSDTPETDADFRDQLAAQYGGRVAGTGGNGTGAGGGSGVGGSSASGSGGSATGAGGGAMAGSAGGGSTVGGTGGSSSSACDGFALLSIKCSGGSCHSGTTSGSLSNFALDETTAKGFAGQQSSTCKTQDNAPMFDPDNPPASLVIKKITATASCGGRMPLGATMQALTSAEVDCLEDWIGSLD
jgi:hypothetical protein